MRIFILGRLSIAEMLIEKGAEVDALDSNEQSPLHLASRYEQVEIVKLLLKVGGLKIIFKSLLNQLFRA